MPTPTLLLLAVTALSACVVFGGALYEALAVDPFWPRRPGIVQARNGGIARHRFWTPAYTAFEVLLVVSLVAAWADPAVRTAPLVAAGGHAVARGWALLDSPPEAADPAGVDEAAAVAWTRRGLLRLPLELIACGSLLIALMFG
ncbi:hypothetical protein AU196_09560 [Mycobacterium sp. IS-1742]|uniref:hypothetical protein n=1 Tax=Mycobacterium sp. IS-1742 TaxID=1772285 RepID=UPI00074055E4|nr:hypothetical protein [Mycobacterium sp. IS-1742]KUI23993.1 hypothetical protein AU196_09560 [Mycobacterium sp. IS-1742]